MKHLLNNLTEDEKNKIREQHKGGMKVMTENFSKLVNSKLGDVKPMLNEASAEMMAKSLVKLNKSLTEEQKKKLEECVDNFPQLKSVIGSLGFLGLGTVTLLMLILAFGLEVSIGSLFLIFISTLGLGIDVKGLMEVLKDFNKKELVVEAKKVFECASINLFQYGI